MKEDTLRRGAAPDYTAPSAEKSWGSTVYRGQSPLQWRRL